MSIKALLPSLEGKLKIMLCQLNVKNLEKQLTIYFHWYIVKCAWLVKLSSIKVFYYYYYYYFFFFLYQAVCREFQTTAQQSQANAKPSKLKL